MTKRAPEEQIADWRRQLATMGRVEIGIDRARSMILIAVATAFVAGGVTLVLSGSWVGCAAVWPASVWWPSSGVPRAQE